MICVYNAKAWLSYESNLLNSSHTNRTKIFDKIVHSIAVGNRSDKFKIDYDFVASIKMIMNEVHTNEHSMLSKFVKLIKTVSLAIYKTRYITSTVIYQQIYYRLANICESDAHTIDTYKCMHTSII